MVPGEVVEWRRASAFRVGQGSAATGWLRGRRHSMLGYQSPAARADGLAHGRDDHHPLPVLLDQRGGSLQPLAARSGLKLAPASFGMSERLCVRNPAPAGAAVPAYG